MKQHIKFQIQLFFVQNYPLYFIKSKGGDVEAAMKQGLYFYFKLKKEGGAAKKRNII